ncbi:hypothetical protein [Actinophytocola gossypii]|uniref:Uncharacterized protein n=1 Tax=Actinophytocola gossypii TaxID=2812003 RepID=A0ABT2JCQ3_9PSEU|nr:hypothetical protein [Actinophytocola gossypii]MCT2585651.1 hypothetical protein [Actinophytocola gossypii]
MSYAAAYGGHDRVPAERRLRREHPLGVPRTYADPADEVDETGTGRKWTFGVAAGALLVAGTFAAGALGLNNGVPLATDHAAPEHAPASPGNNPNDIGGPAAVAPPDREADSDKRKPAEKPAPKPVGSVTPAPDRQAPSGAHGGSGGSGGDITTPAPQPAPAPAPAPAPQPAPQPTPPPPAPEPAPEPRPGPVEQIVTPVTDTVGGILDPVTDTVGDVLSPVTGLLSAGDRPAMTMIDDPMADLVGK